MVAMIRLSRRTAKSFALYFAWPAVVVLRADLAGA